MKRILLIVITISCLINTKSIGQYWSALGDGIGFYGGPGTAETMALYNGDLYVGGILSQAGSAEASHIAKWNGTSWSAVGDGLNGPVYALTTYNGDLYAGGYFSFAGNVPSESIAKWNGTEWSAVGTGINGAVNAMTVVNDTLYVGGLFTKAGAIDANNIAKWDGSNWSPLGAGTKGRVNVLEGYNGSLYAGGSFDSAGGQSANRIAKWNGTSWSPLDVGMDNEVFSLRTYRGSLYAGGRFRRAGNTQASYIAKWDGSTWTAVGDGMNAMVVSLSNDNNEFLYAGGHFATAGNISALHVAKWNDTSWASLGAGTGSIVGATVAKDGILYVGATLNSAGTIPVRGVAKWTEQCNAVPPQPGIITGLDTVCAGVQRTFSIVPVNEAASYTWTLPAGWLGTSDIPNIDAYPGSAGGLITVMANNPCGVSVARSFNATVIPFSLPPKPTVIKGDSLVCFQTTRIYSVDKVPGVTDYTWLLPWGWEGFSTIDSIIAIVGEEGTLSVVANNSCGSSEEKLRYIKVTSVPWPPGINGPGTPCKDSTVTYSTSYQDPDIEYTWSLPSGWTGSSTSSEIMVKVGVTGGTISVYGKNMCGIGNPSTYDVVLDSILPTPATIEGKIKVFTNEWNYYSIPKIPGAFSYTWSASGTALIQSDGNSAAVKWTSGGNHELTVEAINRCGGSPNKLSVEVKDFKDAEDLVIQLLPNPTPGQFYIKAIGLANEQIRIEIINMLGQVVYKEDKIPGAATFSHLINLEKIQPGSYVVKLIVNDKVYQKKLIKIR